MRSAFLLRLAGSGILLVALAASPAWAQGTATVFGGLTDPTGAALPGVTVTVTNLATNVARDTHTDGQGQYIVRALTVGVYDVAAELSGFKRHVQHGIRLQVDENRRLDIRLEVGQVTEAVTVTSEAPPVDTRTGTLKEVVDEKRIVQLPLNGRNPLQLQRLVAGAGGIAGKDQGQNETLSINGARTNSNNYRLDGGDNHDPYFNSPSVFPNPDALQEFSIQTNSYSAAIGRNAGAIMNAVTKSGTNAFHGSAFEFLRDKKLNARSFFAKEAPPFKRNQFGATLGGPIVKDKTFFFVAYQGWRETSAPGAVSAIVPTAAQRGGDLSSLNKTIRDPLTGEAFPGGIIPANRLNPAVQKFLSAMVPLPNGPNGQLSFASEQTFDEDQFIAKVDHHFGSRNTLMARLLRNVDAEGQLPPGNTLPGFLAKIDYDNWNFALNDTHIFSPAVLNVAVFTFNDIDRDQGTVVPGDKTWMDFGAGFVRPFTVPEQAGWDTNVQGYFRAFSRFPLHHYRQNYQLADDLAWTRGGHQLQFGGSFSYSKLDLNERFRGDPQVVFRNTFTGDALSDFLLGRPSAAEQGGETRNRPRTWEIGVYGQDDWKVSPRLTLNLGMRWEPYLPFTEADDRFSQFREGVQSVRFPTAPKGAVFPGDPGVSRAMVDSRWTTFAPRLGFAWDVSGNGKTSIRGGYGIFYAQIRQQAHNIISTNQPFGIRLTWNATNMPLGLDNPYSVTGNPFPFSAPTGDAVKTYRFTTPVQIGTFSPDFQNGRMQQWNVNVQRALLRGWVGTLAYVGSKGDHLFLFPEINPARPGTGSVDSRRLYPGFGTMQAAIAAGKSTYNALQATLNKRFSGGFSVLASYTWSKFLDNASTDDAASAVSAIANPFDLDANRGRSDFDIPHRFVASFIWDLPALEGSGGLVRGVLGGWQLNGIVNVQSGRTFTVNSGLDNSQSGGNRDRADLVGDPKLPGGRSRGEWLNQYFNPAAFTVNAIGTFGTSGRNNMRGPGYAGVDLGVVKEVRVVKEQKAQLRVEVFNLFNHPNFDVPGNTVGGNTFGRVTATAPGSLGDPRVIQLGIKYIF